MAESKDLRGRLGTAAQRYTLANLNLMKNEENLERVYTNILRN